MSIVRDASGSGIAGVLQVKREDQWEAAAFKPGVVRDAIQLQSRKPSIW